MSLFIRNSNISKNNISKKIFCLLNCFNNYEIVGSRIVEYYIRNAIDFIDPTIKYDIQTYFETTPYMFYASKMLSSETIPPAPGTIQRSKQTTDFITILSLAAVTLARIAEADIVVFAAQGVVTMPGFATMYTLANQMNKKVVYWTNDLRNIWGTTNDPLFIGMAPLPYKYLWGSAEKKQPAQFNVQVKGLNGTEVFPNLAKDVNLCPVVSEDKFKNNWNSFVELIQRATTIQGENKSMINSLRTENLIKIGQNIINYIENTKDPKYGRGWTPGVNQTIYYDLEWVITRPESFPLLYPEEQQFLIENLYLKQQPKGPADLNMNAKSFDFDVSTIGRANSQNIAAAMARGLEKMTTMRNTMRSTAPCISRNPN